MEGWFFLDVVVTEGSAVFQLFAGEDESLLIGWDTFFILDLGLDVVDGVWWFHIQSDSLSSQSLHEDLHATSESEHQVEGRFFLNVVVAEGSAIFELLSSEDQSLLIGWDALLVLDLSLHVLDSIWGLNV